MRKARILVVDDEPGMLEVCADTLDFLEQVEVVVEHESTRAAELLEKETFDVLLTDLRMPGLGGVELLRLGRERDPDLPALIMTAYPSVDSAVETMKLGAVDYITKPFLPDDLLRIVQRLLDERQLREENRFLQRQVERAYGFREIVGESDAMQQVYATVARIAPSDVDVLILGETGTGKELIARSIHKHSRRHAQRFVPVDCGAIPETLVESEFFGYERGAFTGANARNIGLLEFTNGGTFFLDEVGELPLQMQAKLLRVLQERKVRRLGGKEEIPIDLRIVAATRRDIDLAIQEKRFREDLYFRISVIRIELPPLRERVDDILPLAGYFLERYARESDKVITDISPSACEALKHYPWPGNVRELQNVIRRGIALCSHSSIDLPELPSHITTLTSQSENLDEGTGFFALREQKIAEFEKAYLTHMLSQYQGDVSAATRAAMLPRGTFYRLLKKYQIQPKHFRP